VRELQALGWETAVEFGFNHYGERGSIDIVGWHAATRSLLLIEAKTLIVNVQELLSSMERKERLAPRLLAAERGWKPASVSTLLVIRESHPARDVLARQAATFDSALPVRTRAARRWLRAPVGRLAGVMFVTESRLRTISGARGRRSRVRRHRTTPLVHG
jgi:hypothetical protein